MFKNPQTQYEKGYNNGFKAHETHVAEGQIKRIEADYTKKNFIKEQELAEREDALDEQMDDYDNFILFKQLIRAINK